MIGSFLNRGLMLIFGYAYPAYECYKSVEMNKPDIEQLRFWCQYWILVALLTVCDRIGDVIIGWVPMYGEAKLAFFIYLWFPKTQGTPYVYNSFIRPYIAKHETQIDHHLLELRTRAGDMAFMYWRKSAVYVQSRCLDILQYIVMQSPPKQPAQPQHEATSVQKSAAPSDPSLATMPQKQDKQASSPAHSNGHHQEHNKEQEAAGPSEDSKAALNKHKTSPSQAVSEASKKSNPSQGQETQVVSVQPSANEIAKPTTTVRDMLMEETGGPFTRGRLRKVTAAASPKH